MKLIKITLIIIAFSSVIMSFYIGNTISVKQQLVYIQNLQNISGIIFAIMGMWISSHYLFFLQEIEKKNANLENIKHNFNIFIKPICTTTCVLLFTVISPTLVLLFKRFSTNSYWTPIGRTILLTSYTIAWIALVYSLYMTLAPLASSVQTLNETIDQKLAKKLRRREDEED